MGLWMRGSMSPCLVKTAFCARMPTGLLFGRCPVACIGDRYYIGLFD